jgi:23S rRNA pseudouridine1911/1915/1917 synthase
MNESRQHNYPKKKKKKVSTYQIENEDTLLASLINNLPHKTRKTLKAVLKDGQVSIDGTPVTQFDHHLTPGQRVEVQWEKVELQKQPRELNIVHIDQDIIVINKPSGLLTVATDKEKRRTAYSMLSNFVKSEDPDNKIFIIHRIDRETSGLLMFARSERVKRQIQETWDSLISRRTYIGIVEGRVTPPDGTITSWLTESKAFIVYSSQNRKHGKKSTTHYSTIEGNNSFSLLQIHLETGRKHQIRVHMQDIQHPIAGDKKYGSMSNPLGRMALHAQVLAFTHPTTGKQCFFDTGIPTQFLKLFRKPEHTNKP